MWAGRRETGNSSLEIQLRQKKVLANRERVRISRANSVVEKHWSQNFRKLSSLERSLFVLMGKDPYPNCSREEALFEYNHPGFCYRRNGDPRLMRSLHESKSRKIVNDLEGRQGLNPEPAINVVSDNPQMAEILSIPELVQILCELRNTAAIMSNEGLFSQFATALQNSSRHPLIGFDGPLDYLKQYRKNLIQEFFDTLESETEMRFFLGLFSKADPNLSMRNSEVHSAPSDMSELVKGSRLPTRAQSAVDVNIRDAEDWNKAVIDGLRRIQEKELENKFGQGTTNKEKTTDSEHDTAWTLNRYIEDLHEDDVPPLYSDKAIGLLTTKYLEESRRELRTPGGMTPVAPTPPTTPYSQSTKQNRVEFDNFVRHLIAKVETLDEMSQHVLAFRRKRPNRHAGLIDPLVKLLKRQSLFSSLNDADLRHSLDIDKDSTGSDKDSSSHPAVKYFEVPNIPDQEEEPESISKTVDSILDITKPKMGSANKKHLKPNNLSDSFLPKQTSKADTLDFFAQAQKLTGTHSRSSTPANNDLTDEDEQISSKHVHFSEVGKRPTATSITFQSTICDSSASTTGKCSLGSSGSSGPGSSRHRASCRACREKVKQACAQMQQREAMCSKSKDVYACKIPELSNWPHEYKELSAGARARENVRSLSEIRRKEKMAKSVYLIPAPKAVTFQKGAPTPRFPRRSTIPPDFSAFPFQNQGLGFGEDILNAFKIGGESNNTDSTDEDVTMIVMPSTGVEIRTSTVGSRSKASIGKKTIQSGKSAASGLSSSVMTGIKSKPSVSSRASKVHLDSWTLHVSKLDIMRLRHELDVQSVNDKMMEFEHKFLNP